MIQPPQATGAKLSITGNIDIRSCKNGYAPTDLAVELLPLPACLCRLPQLRHHSRQLLRQADTLVLRTKSLKQVGAVFDADISYSGKIGRDDPSHW